MLSYGKPSQVSELYLVLCFHQCLFDCILFLWKLKCTWKCPVDNSLDKFTSPFLPAWSINSIFTALMLGVVKTGRNSNYSSLAVLYTVSAHIKGYCLNLLFNFHPLRAAHYFRVGVTLHAPHLAVGAINMSKLKAAPSVRSANACSRG